MAQKIEREELMKILSDLSIDTDTIDHPEVYTVEQALQYMSKADGVFAKNLFLKDKKKKLWLLCAPHEAEVKLNDVTKMVGASGVLRFADENILYDKLGVKQGAVTIFGLINDANKDVTLILDKRLSDGTIKCAYFHPLVNNASVGISFEGLAQFLEHTGHKPVLVTLTDAQ